MTRVRRARRLRRCDGARAPSRHSSWRQRSSLRRRGLYKAPRTPDGQPDLQGFWTNSTYTPLERPDNVTKALYTPEEAEAAIKLACERESAQTEPGTTADVHYDFSQFALDRSQSAFVRNLRTSLIVDPPNGKIPPLTAEGKRRPAQRAEEQPRNWRPMGLGREQSARRSLPDHGRPRTADDGCRLQQQLPDRAGAGHVMILTEMIHDVRIIPLDGRPQPHANVRQWMGVSRGRWEGDTLVVETTNFNGKNPFRGSEREPAGHRTVHPRRRRRDPVQVHHRRSVDVDEAVDRGDADEEDGGSDLRARLSRGQLRPLQHAGRRQARREEGGRRRLRRRVRK